MHHYPRIWRRIPALRPFVAIAAGITLGWNQFLSAPVAAITLAVLFTVAILHECLSSSFRLRTSLFAGVLIHSLLLTLGVWITSQAAARRQPPLSIVPDFLVALEEPESTPSGKKLIAEPWYHLTSGWKKGAGLIVYYPGTDTHLSYGSVIITRALPQPIQNLSNPGGFDFKNYCFYQGITAQVFLRPGQYRCFLRVKGSAWKRLVISSRNYVLHTLRRFLSGSREQGLAEALLIGYRQDLDPELVRAYSNTGVVHVIAISGLHIGLIYSILMMLTVPIMRRWLMRLLVVLIPLWLFTFMAGAQPSVLRSALMFSMLAIGQAGQRRASVFHSLFLSAIVLVCIRPYWLGDAGFLLSYLAVLSILIFHRPLYHSVQFDHPFVDLLWNMTAVTLAAQILTLPISIYLFHQLPLLFLFTNLLAVPLSSCILLLLILLCMLGWSTLIGAALARIILALLVFMNHYIERFDGLPFTALTSLSINIVQALLLSAAMLLTYRFRKNPYRFFALTSLIVFCLIRFLDFHKASGQLRLIVYDTPRHTCIDLVSGRVSAYHGAALPPLMERRNLEPCRTLYRFTPSFTFKNSNHLCFAGHCILLIKPGRPVVSHDTEFSFAIVSGQVYNAEEWLGTIHIKVLILDASLRPRLRHLWKQACSQFKIECYDVQQNGAFDVSLQPLPLSPCPLARKER